MAMLARPSGVMLVSACLVSSFFEVHGHRKLHFELLADRSHGKLHEQTIV